MYEYTKGWNEVQEILNLIGCSSKIVTIRLTKKNNRKEEAVMKWHTQAGNIATNIKVKIDFTLPELSAEKIVACNFNP